MNSFSFLYVSCILNNTCVDRGGWDYNGTDVGAGTRQGFARHLVGQFARAARGGPKWCRNRVLGGLGGGGRGGVVAKPFESYQH